MNGLEAASIRLQRRTSSQRHRQVHLRLKRDIVACLAGRRLDAQLAGRAVDRHVHEAVECNGNTVGHDAMRRERSSQIAEAALVRFLVAVDDAESVSTAGCEEEVVAAAGVGDDTQKDVTAVGVERVAGREVDAAGVIERAAGGEGFVEVVRVEGEEVGDLATSRVNYRKLLSLKQREGAARANWDFGNGARGGLHAVVGDGHFGADKWARCH